MAQPDSNQNSGKAHACLAIESGLFAQITHPDSTGAPLRRGVKLFFSRIRAIIERTIKQASANLPYRFSYAPGIVDRLRDTRLDVWHGNGPIQRRLRL